MIEPDSDDKEIQRDAKADAQTPPKPHKDASKEALTKSVQKMKPGGPPAKNDHPEEDS